MANATKILCKENNEQEKQLTKENNKILTDIIVYLSSSNLCEYDIQVIRKELLGMAIESQLRGKDFATVVGGDYKDFCNELIKNGRKKTGYEKVLEFLYVLAFGIGALFLYEIVLHMIGIIVKKGVNDLSLQLPITLGFVVSTMGAVIIAYGVVHFISKNSFELTLGKKYKIIFICAFSVVSTALILLRVHFNSVILFSVNFLYLAAFWAITLIIVKFLNDQYSNHLAKTHK